MAKKKGRPIDPLQLYVNARSFHAASMSLDAQSEKHLLFWPMVVNEVFALELFIKCLHRVRRRTLTGHDVHVLFRKLSKADRRIVAKYFQEIVAAHRLYHEFVALGVQFDVESVLQRSRNTFMRVRYWHEGELPDRDSSGISSSAGTGSLSDAINRLILELRPEWRELGIRVPVRWDNTLPST